MKKETNKLKKIYLASGIFLAQITTIGTSVYATDNNLAFGFSMQFDKKKVQVDEEVTISIKNVKSERENVEVLIPDGIHYNAEITRELNKHNKMVESICLIDNSTIQIRKKLEEREIGEIILSITPKKAGDFIFKLRLGHSEKELELGSTHLNVMKREKEIPIPQWYDHSIKPQGAQINSKVADDGNERVFPSSQNQPVEPKIESVLREDNQVELEMEDAKKDNEEINKEKLPTVDMDVKNEPYKDLLQYPNINIVNVKTGEGPIIPGEYALQWRWSKKVRYRVSGSGSDYNNQLSLYQFKKGNRNKQAYVHIENVGVYKGRWVDLRINIIDLKDVTDFAVHTPRNEWEAKSTFLMLYGNGKKGATADILYEFYDHETEEKLKVSGMWNVKRLNWYKSIDLKVDENHLNNLYAYNNTSIKYKNNGDGTVNFLGTAFDEEKDTNMTFTYKDLSELPMRIRLEQMLGYIKYDRDAISKIGMPNPEVIGERTEDDSKELYYHVYQEVPSQTKATNNIKSFILESEVDKNFIVKDVRILDGSDNAMEKYFDIKVENNKIMAAAKVNNINKLEFSDNFFDMQVRGVLAEGADYKRYYKNGYLEIPVSAKNYVDGDIKGQFSNEGIAKIKYKGVPIGEAVPQTVKVGTDLRKMDISTFVTGLSVDTDADIDCPIYVERLEDIPNMEAPGDYFVTVIIRTSQGVEAKVQVPIRVIEGTLNLVEVPKNISFRDVAIPSKPTIYNRSSVQGKITVSDERITKRKWYLYVKELKPLINKEGNELAGAIVYTKNGVDYSLSTENLEIMVGQLKGNQNYVMDWKVSEGIRLRVEPGPHLKVSTKYTGELEWTLKDTPI